MSSPFVGEITIFAFNFAPTGWAQCRGQLLPISQNTALFSLLGTMYGGNGQSNFALPDFQDSVPNSSGQSTTGTQYFQGQTGGSPFVTLLQTEIPAHQHFFSANTTTGTTAAAPNNQLGVGTVGNKQNSFNANIYSTTVASATTAMSPLALSVTGQSLPHNNMQPYLTLNFCIAMQGVFPPRS
ncbi:MAG: tail fiber protein [Xanthobacteraceae bacterium]